MTTEEKLPKLLQDFAEVKAKLVAENAELRARIKALEPQPRDTRPPPTDYSQFLSIPRSALEDLVRNVPDKVCNDLALDAYPELGK